MSLVAALHAVQHRVERERDPGDYQVVVSLSDEGVFDERLSEGVDVVCPANPSGGVLAVEGQQQHVASGLKHGDHLHIAWFVVAVN